MNKTLVVLMVVVLLLVAGETGYIVAIKSFENAKILGLRKTNSSRADLLIGDSPFIRRCKSPAPNQIIYCEK